MQSTGIDERDDFHAGQVSKARVLQLQVSVHQSHMAKVRMADRSSLQHPIPTHLLSNTPCSPRRACGAQHVRLASLNTTVLDACWRR